jgi:GNAT superfamily N-acetyltransferase
VQARRPDGARGYRTLPDLVSLRDGDPGDLDALARIDLGFIGDKRDFIERALRESATIVAERDGRIVGYLIWDLRFFSRAFVWLVAADPAVRRHGLATRLIAAFEAATPGEPRFVSTNASNAPMHALLAKLGYVRSGQVENLDPGDPEVFYFKGR